MPHVKFGKKNEPGFDLELSDDLIAVRTHSRRSLLSRGPVTTPLEGLVDDGALVAAYPEAGVEVYRLPVKGAPAARAMESRKEALRTHSDVRFAGGVLVEPATKEPVLYTENLFIKFKDSADPDACEQVIQSFGLQIKQRLDYAVNAYFVAPPEGAGRQVFELAETLLKRDDVEYCHPELIRPRSRKAIFPGQWHLAAATVDGTAVTAHASVASAHELSQGAGITIAIIDDGVDIDHPEFASSAKVVGPRDVTQGTDNPRPKDPFPEDPENHGTACAGVACADGVLGASGVAPKARLMPIRLASNLGSIQEANAFKWAVDHGADIISCSWGPVDGRWFDPNDPRHNRVDAIPASTRLAIDAAVQNGRGGKGCVVLFAAGNGNESVDNDGYASHANVIAVAACSDRGTRSVYSDFGKAVWCSFPSSDFGHQPFSHPEPLTPGIWTTDRRGAAGYNQGSVVNGDAAGNFANDFGGTSSACPGAAGVAALVLAVNPALTSTQVRDILKRSCDKIDPQNGSYDATGHSKLYGFGRLNARRAVELAAPQPTNAVTVQRTFDAPIPDLQTVEFQLNVADATIAESVSVPIDLRHTFIGDLVLTLTPPAAAGAPAIVLHRRAGGSTRDIRRTFDSSTTPALAALAGKNCKGAWTLKIEDKAAVDAGTLVSFGLEIRFRHPSDRTVQPARLARRATARKKAAKRR
ncbi:MAG: S8 family serine peptidase [Bryobacteraceae bacterium]